MATIHVFDPALCCPSGVCGRTVDPKLAAFSVDLAWIAPRSARGLRSNPHAIASGASGERVVASPPEARP